MKVEVFVLTDAATDTMGKLNILGAFDTVWAPKVPAIRPVCALAIRLRFERIERGEHKIRVNVIDEDGSHIVPSLNAQLKINFPDDIPSQAVNLILTLQRMKFDVFGEYSLDLAINGQQVATTPLFVRERKVVAG